MRTSFGLDNAYIESVYEELFLLKQNGNWSFFEAYNLPIMIRRWFLRRLVRYFEEQNEAAKKAIK